MGSKITVSATENGPSDVAVSSTGQYQMGIIGNSNGSGSRWHNNIYI